MGDAGVEIEDDLIEKYNLKDIDVLKVDIMEVRQAVVKILLMKLI